MRLTLETMEKQNSKTAKGQTGFCMLYMSFLFLGSCKFKKQ